MRVEAATWAGSSFESDILPWFLMSRDLKVQEMLTQLKRLLTVPLCSQQPWGPELGSQRSEILQSGGNTFAGLGRKRILG